MRGATGGGMGAGMRGAVTGAGDIAKGFEQAQQAYKKDIYGLEKGAEKAYEGELSTFLKGLPKAFETGTGGAKVTEGYFTTPTPESDEEDFRRGGRVPKRGETFLNFLTQLPEAGGS